MDMNMDVRTSRSRFNRTLEIFVQTRELVEGTSNVMMMHRWKLHEILTLRQFCLDFCGKLKYRSGNKDYYWNQNLTSASLQ
jgi:hypothetical protein